MNRSFVFWFVCIPARVLLAYVAYRRQGNAVGIRSVATLVAATWLLDLQHSPTGFFGGPVWWADARKFHGLVWALYAYTGDWRFLAGDAASGAAVWIGKKSYA